MTVKRIFQVDSDGKSMNDIFHELVKGNIDSILRNTYAENKVNTAASHTERKDV